jgi:hypothetical protein
MKHKNFSFTLCFIFSIQVLLAQKLEKIYTSSSKYGILGNTTVKLSLGGLSIVNQKNRNIKTTDNGVAIEFTENNSDSIIFDYISNEGKTILNKKIIKSDIDDLLGEPNRFISDSSRLIILNSKNGILNIQIYDINTGSIIQTIKTKTDLGDLFKENKYKIRTEEYKLYSKNKNHLINGGHLFGNMLLVNIYTNFYPPLEYTPYWIDLSKPEKANLIFPDFPTLNNDEHKVRLQFWNCVTYDSGKFIYTRNYFLDKGPNTGNACTVAEFDNDGKLIKQIDLDLTIDEYSTFHTFKYYKDAAQVKYNPEEKAFYLVSSLASDKKINGNTYGIVLKKIDLSGKNIWEKMYFNKELYDEIDATVFKYPQLSLKPMGHTFSIGFSLGINKLYSVTFNSSNGEYISKQKIAYTDFVKENVDLKLEKQIKEEMEFGKYKENLQVTLGIDKNILVLFKDEKGGFSVYKYK